MNSGKLLITGATGFVGGFLTEEAVNRGYEVMVSARKTSDTSYIKHLPIQFIDLKFNDLKMLQNQLWDLQPDFIIHNAGLTKAKTQEELDQVNAVNTLHLAEASRNLGGILKKFIFVSSLAAYGPAEFQPAEIVNDNSVPKPVTMYGRSKFKAETQLKEIKDLPWLIIRPTAVYGPREKDLYTVFKMINSGLSVHAGKGDQKLTFVYVLDLVNYMLGLLNIEDKHKSFFASDGKLYTSRQFNEIIGRNLGRKTIKFGLPLPILKLSAQVSEWVGKLTDTVPALNVDKLNEITAKSWHCDHLPLIEATSYQPKFTLEEGVVETIEWYKSNQWLS